MDKQSDPPMPRDSTELNVAIRHHQEMAQKIINEACAWRSEKGQKAQDNELEK